MCKALQIRGFEDEEYWRASDVGDVMQIEGVCVIGFLHDSPSGTSLGLFGGWNERKY